MQYLAHPINKDLLDDLREEGLLVIDHPSRKVGIVANTSGQVLIAVQEDGGSLNFCIEPEEVTAICHALIAWSKKAYADMNAITAAYEANEVIQKMMGGA